MHTYAHIHVICRQGSAPGSLSKQEFMGPWTSEMLQRGITLGGLPLSQAGRTWIYSHNEKYSSDNKVLAT